MDPDFTRKLPAVCTLIAICAGIVAADLLSLPLWIYFITLIAAFPLTLALYLKNKPTAAAIAGLTVIASFAGFMFTLNYQTSPPKHIIHLADDGNKYTLYCTIDDWPILAEHRTILYCRVDSVGGDDKQRESMGRILLNIGRETTALQYGDRIYFDSYVYSIKGGKNPSGYDYRRHLNLKGIAASCYLPHEYSLQSDRRGRGHPMNVIDDIRAYIINTFNETLDKRAAAVASGFLIGETRDIPSDIYQYFRDTGTLHLLAVSGSNVWLVLLVFLVILKASPWSQVTRTIILIGVVVLFSFLSYNQPSVVRASVMAILVLIGRAAERKLELNNIIASAAVVILLYDPAQLYNIGFQLSFATAWGLIFLTPRVGKLFRKVHTRWYYRYLIFPSLISIVAQVVALPLSAYYFERVPAISFVSNLVIIPLVSILVVGEVIILFGALIVPMLGLMFGSILNALFAAAIFLLRLFGGGTFGIPLEISLGGGFLVVYFASLIMGVQALASLKARRLLVVVVLLIANFWAVCGLFESKDQNKLTVFSTPGGLIAVLEHNRAAVFLSDLPRKDYSITERVVRGYLKNAGFRAPVVIELSGRFASIMESISLAESFDSSTLYIPAASEKMMTDIAARYKTNLSHDRIVLFSGTAPESSSNMTIHLFNGGAKVIFDSLEVYLLAQRTESAFDGTLDLNSTKKLVIVKETLTASDIECLGDSIASNNLLFICRNVDRRRAGEIESILLSERLFQNLVLTSQVGAVELLISDGRIKSIN